MKNFYHYFFYKLYKFVSYTSSPEFALNGAVIYLSIALFFYILTLDIYFELFLNIYKIPNNKFSIVMLILAIFIYYSNYYYFKRPSLISQIDEKFRGESKQSDLIGKIIVFLTIIGSIVIFIFVGYIGNKK
ncbi:hypothetical protein NHF50_07970 [Flavobacterium sp. NRK F10]|uniref:hypothetical protein n=1 Tax=Flavobacterium sp. NRK F10 TaxID=2954931 RepID=UPI0020916EF0|nr:hypothetical protein [Flavobacterium sp. NRK F10]MCO6174982.1 hypothetical protein [Flavobacterium sp. NRK F10]